MVNLRELWEYRDLLLTVGVRDVKLRYKQTALGIAWVLIQPLLAGAIFAFVFGRVANLPAPGGMPYFLFAFTGLLGWTIASTTIVRSSNSMVNHADLVGKVYFPRLVLPTSAIFTAMLDFVVGFALLLILLPAFWRWPPATIVFLPIPVLLMLAFGLGLGLIAAAVSVPYRDIAYVLPTAVQFLLYASPVAYSASIVPAAYRDLYFLNPVAGLLELFRWSILGVGDISTQHILYSAGVSLGLLTVGGLVFQRMERTFADVI